MSEPRPDTPDTGAGTPPEWIDLAADIRAVDGNHDLGAGTLAAALTACGWTRRPATDPAGLDVERLMTAYNNILVRPGIGWPPKRSEWDQIAAEYVRLSVADGPGPEERPEIVCLCGSTRFYDEFQAANYDLTMLGKIVLSVGFYPHALTKHGHGEGVGHDSSEKVALDELHKRKIDLADRVYVLNVGGYIGDSTRSEIEYAEAHNKPVDYLEPGGIAALSRPLPENREEPSR